MSDEKPRVLVDINIFIDVIEKRSNWENSLAVIAFVDNANAEGFVSALTYFVLYFRRARIKSDSISRKEVREILRSFKIVPLDEAIIINSLDDGRFNDIEDAVQFHSGKTVSSCMVTRNKKHFTKVSNDLEVLNPEEFMEKYA